VCLVHRTDVPGVSLGCAGVSLGCAGRVHCTGVPGASHGCAGCVAWLCWVCLSAVPAASQGCAGCVAQVCRVCRLGVPGASYGCAGCVFWVSSAGVSFGCQVPGVSLGCQVPGASLGCAGCVCCSGLPGALLLKFTRYLLHWGARAVGCGVRGVMWRVHVVNSCVRNNFLWWCAHLHECLIRCLSTSQPAGSRAYGGNVEIAAAGHHVDIYMLRVACMID